MFKIKKLDSDHGGGLKLISWSELFMQVYFDLNEIYKLAGKIFL